MEQVASLSGGKDSTAMLLMMLERGEKVDDIVFFDFGMEFPQMYEHLEKLEKYIGRRITRVYPKHRFEYYMADILKIRGIRKGQRGYGWPAFRRRWCTRVKTDALLPFTKGKIKCIGFTADEALRAKDRINTRFPLVEWNIAGRDALNYCYSKSFDFGGLYTLFNRVSCWCCPFQGRRELLLLREHFPDLWKELLRLDSRTLYPWPDKDLQEIKMLREGERQELLPFLHGHITINEH